MKLLKKLLKRKDKKKQLYERFEPCTNPSCYYHSKWIIPLNITVSVPSNWVMCFSCNQFRRGRSNYTERD